MQVVAVQTLAGPGDFITDPVTDLFGGAAKAVAGQILSMLGSAIISGLADACSQVAHGVLGFMDASSGIDLEAGWWAGERAQMVRSTILAVAVGLALLFVFLALLQGILAGDVGGMIRLVVREVPAAAIGTVLLGAVATLLLKLTDTASASVLAGAPGDLEAFLRRLAVPGAAPGYGLLGGVVLAVFLLAGLFVWVELLVRSALLYLLIAFAPLVLAARVWPITRGAFRRLCDLGVALIVAKFAVAAALALGAAALAGGGPQLASPGVAEPAGISIGSMLAGASLMATAAFTPFVVLRILPVLETAVIAQGVSRSPVRAVQSGAQGAYYVQGLQRMAAGSRPSARMAPSPAGIATGSLPPRPSAPNGQRPDTPARSADPSRPRPAHNPRPPKSSARRNA